MPDRTMNTFLSYPSEKHESAKEVYDFIRSLCIPIWFDRESLIAGQQWDREIALAQRSADLIILICSPETVGKSGVIQREIKEAIDLAKDKPLGHVFLVPIRTEEISLPQELNRYHYVDLFRSGWQLKLAQSIKLRLEQLGSSSPAALAAFFETKEIEGKIELKTLRFEGKNYEAQADYFLYRRPGLFWDYVNAEITSDAAGGFLRAKVHGPNCFKDRGYTGEWSLRVEEHFSRGELVSLTFAEWADWGGAHPTRGVYAKNYGAQEGGKIAIEELFDHNIETLDYIRKYCELQVRLELWDGKEESDYSLPRYDDDSEIYIDPWELFSQWNFDDNGLHIWLGQHSGLPFVMGTFNVLIPWALLKDKVATDYLKTSIGQLIISE